jgi:acid stress-induced BolA-like protein IbaG/YrbA
MDLQSIETDLRVALGDCTIEMDSEGNKLAIEIVSDVFEGLSRVKRQQLVYKALNERIESGEIHAVSMRTYSPEEAQ